MKKTILLFIAVVSMGLSLLAQQPLYTIKENSFETIKIQFNAPDLQTSYKKVADDLYSILKMDGYLSSSVAGNPQLPVLSKTLEIPICEDVRIEVLSASYKIYSAEELGIEYEVYPAQMSYSKSYSDPVEFFKSAEVYQNDAFYGEPLARVEKVGIMRNINMANIYISPVQYNPVTRRVKIYHNIEIAVSFRHADIPSTYEMKNLHTNGLFLGSQSALVVNPIAPMKRDGITSAPVKYLIVAHAMFRGALDEFIKWKKRKGFLVEIAYTDDDHVGTTTATIQNFIKSKYTGATPANPAPSYVLLVGDVQQIPAFSYDCLEDKSKHVSDLDYFLWTAGDNIPDCYYGRFSAQNIAQLTSQIEKTLQIEQYTMPDPSYLGNAVLVAGVDNSYSSTHGNGQVNYLSNNYINTNYGYTAVSKYLHPAGNYEGEIRAKLNEGVGYANYTAHCDDSGWSNPAFKKSHLNAMNNANRYGFFVGNCCLSSKFDETECFGEAVVRASQKGAVAYIGASNNTYWDEDYYWTVGVRNYITANPSYDAGNLGAYDRLFHTRNEAFTDWFTSAGAMIAAGNMAVQSSVSLRKDYYWQVYNLMGDPSLMPYLSVPQNIGLSCSNVLVTGSTFMEVQAKPYAYIALTLNNELIAAAFANSVGVATLTFAPLTSNQYEVTASAQNCVTAFQTINVTDVSAIPYAIVSSFELDQTSVPQIDATIHFDLTVKNRGGQPSSGVYVKLHTLSSNVKLTVDSLFIGELDVDQEITYNQVFTANLSSYFLDGTLANFFVTVHFDNNYSQKALNVKLLAPRFVREGFAIQDLNGDEKSVINPDKTFKIILLDRNAGHAGLTDVQASLISNYTKVRLEETNQIIPEMDVNQSTETSFLIHFDSSVRDGETYKLYYRIKKDGYVLYDTLMLMVGLPNYFTTEKFENNDFESFPWENENLYPWKITNNRVHEGEYCARSNDNLPDGKISELSITVNVLFDSEISYFRKVSSEVDYDFFRFFIDDEEKEKLSGEIDWEKAVFPVLAGQRTFNFQYTKDPSLSRGTDCAWIDNIVFPVFGVLAKEDTLCYFPDEEVAIKENVLSSILVYPNPAHEQVSVVSNAMIETVTIFDLNGRLIDSFTGKGKNRVEINVNGLPNGFYLIKIQHADQKEVVKKLIKQ